MINGLTDFGHPCQAMADIYTIRELVGRLEGCTLAWIGDANNVARSVALGCGKTGMKMVMATPEPYQFSRESLAWIKAQSPGLDLVVTTDPVAAVCDAVAIYTDVWASMGQEAEREARRRDFLPYQVNAELMSHAQKGAVFMHCLPARRGEEVTDEVIDGPQSVVIQQAGQPHARAEGHPRLAAGSEGIRGAEGEEAAVEHVWKAPWDNIWPQRLECSWQLPTLGGSGLVPDRKGVPRKSHGPGAILNSFRKSRPLPNRGEEATDRRRSGCLV